MSRGTTRQRLLPLAFAALVLACSGVAKAEPYLAIYKGLHCSSCHSHESGGGMRNAYGNVFAQMELPANVAQNADKLWNGQVNSWLSAGADLRGRYEYVDDGDNRSAFDITRGTVYVEASLYQGRALLYVDQQIAPSSSINREAYVKLKGKQFNLTAGQFYLPYGLRLQDDTAFVRRATGINFTNPDRGVQLGYENGRWSSALSLTNGSGGGSEIDDGKQLSAVTSYATPRWRIGASINHNNADGGDRSMANLFGGLKTGNAVWLFEVDAIRDEIAGASDLDGIAGIAEVNWLLRRGHNLKVSYEYLDPDTDTSEDHQIRWSLLYELTPFPYLQARFGVRANDGPPQTTDANREVGFVELHAFF
ncbi:MAG: porin [Woeseiaceae bacterium]|nr:porin [Woeseiaceae bacterium]